MKIYSLAKILSGGGSERVKVSSYRTESFGISWFTVVLYSTYVFRKNNTKLYMSSRWKYHFLYKFNFVRYFVPVKKEQNNLECDFFLSCTVIFKLLVHQSTVSNYLSKISCSRGKKYYSYCSLWIPVQYSNVPLLLPSEINGDSAADGLFNIMLISDQVSKQR